MKEQIKKLVHLGMKEKDAKSLIRGIALKGFREAASNSYTPPPDTHFKAWFDLLTGK